MRHCFADVIIVLLKSIRSDIELIVKAFDISVKYVSIDDDSDFDTLDSLRLIKDYIKVFIIKVYDQLFKYILFKQQQ